MTRDYFAGLARDAAARYPAQRRFARHFAYGKLTRDPAFRFVLERGYISPSSTVLDLGCGQGVLCALLAAARSRDTRDWPQDWAVCPSESRVRCIEIDERAAALARAAADARDEAIHGDIRDVAFGAADVCILLDVLHYLDRDAQQRILTRARDALAAGGVLLIRVADAARGLRFNLTTLLDRLSVTLRGRLPGAYHCRPLDEWVAILARLGFRVEAIPMSEGTPFANVLLVARLG